LPGGKVDAGEPFDAALVREVAEETGLVVSLDGVAGAAEYEMPAVRVAILFMEARRTGGQVRLSSEHDSFQWVKREQILELDLCDQLRSFLEDYCQRRSLHD
jgi:8-oxo-dGTP diphosphatase